MTPAEFVKRLQNHFGPPEHAADEKALAADYAAALAGTHPTVLQQASDRLISKHQYRNWPTIGECRLAVEVVAAEWSSALARMRRGHTGVEIYPPPTEEQRQRVSDLVRATTALLAEKERLRRGKPILHALYEEIHGRPYRESDWR